MGGRYCALFTSAYGFVISLFRLFVSLSNKLDKGDLTLVCITGLAAREQ